MSRHQNVWQSQTFFAMMKHEVKEMDLLEKVRAGIVQLAEQYGLERVILFGARAVQEELLASIRREGVVLYERRAA